jgi:hypothetical protein
MPIAFGGIIYIEQPQIQRFFSVGSMRAPRLESAGILYAALFVEIVGIKNQRFSLGIEHTPIGFVRLPISLNVIDLRNVEVASTHQLSDVVVVCEKQRGKPSPSPPRWSLAALPISLLRRDYFQHG